MTMTQRLRVVQASDLHLNPQRADHRERFDRLWGLIASLSPDLIVLSGDLSDDGVHHPSMLPPLAALLSTLPAPVRLVPGNHDVGNRAGLNHPVTAAAVERWDQAMGATPWREELGGWRMLGINSQVLGSGLPAEAAQWDWLAQALEGEAPTAVFLHTPLYLGDPEQVITDRSAYWLPGPAERQRLLNLLARPQVKLIGSGHTHWGGVRRWQDKLVCWCPPASGLVVRDPHFPPGDGPVGVALHTLTPDGVATTLHPLDVERQTLDFADAVI